MMLARMGIDAGPEADADLAAHARARPWPTRALPDDIDFDARDGSSSA